MRRKRSNMKEMADEKYYFLIFNAIGKKNKHRSPMQFENPNPRVNG